MLHASCDGWVCVVYISGEQGWRSGESTCLPPSLLLVLFSALRGFPLSSKTKTSKFQFDPECCCSDVKYQVVVIFVRLPWVVTSLLFTVLVGWSGVGLNIFCILMSSLATNKMTSQRKQLTQCFTNVVLFSILFINPLSPNSDQSLLSPYSIVISANTQVYEKKENDHQTKFPELVG